MIGDALAAAAFAAGDRSMLARIHGPIGEAARSAFDQLAAMSGEAQREQRVSWCATARAPVAPGLRGIDPSWIEAALDELPARARDAIATGAATEADVWLARWTCAELPAMPSIEPALVRPHAISDIARLGAPALRAWLEDVGADQLAFALGAHAATFGARVVAAAARIARPPRDGRLGQRRAAIERARIEPEPLALARIGARAIAPHVDPLVRRQLVLRLPRPAGLVIARELRAHARDPVELAPSWDAATARVIA